MKLFFFGSCRPAGHNLVNFKAALEGPKSTCAPGVKKISTFQRLKYLCFFALFAERSRKISGTILVESDVLCGFPVVLRSRTRSHLKAIFITKHMASSPNHAKS